MSWFRSGRSWSEEYDQRLSDPTVKKDVMKGSFIRGAKNETRVADDNGVMRRRNGAVCCGCGQGEFPNGYEGWDLDKPAYDPHSHHDSNDTHHEKEDPPRGFFTSWL